MVHTIVLNRDNISTPNNNRFVYNITGTKSTEGCEIALGSLYMYYSWTNINANPNNNNTFSFTFPPLTVDADGQDLSGNLGEPTEATTFKVTLPDGVYSTEDINYFLQSYCITNNLYMVDTSTGEYKYFLQMQTNLTQYKMQFNSFALPNGGAIPSELTMPAAGFGTNETMGDHPNGAFPATDYVGPGWYFPDNMSTFMGFAGPTYLPSENPGYYVMASPYPSGAASSLSTVTPRGQPNDVLYLNVNLVRNSWANPSTFLYPISAGNSVVGEQIVIHPSEYTYNSMQPGVASQIIVTLTTVEGADIKILDPNTVITLLIKEPKDKFMQMTPHSIHGQPSNPNMHQLSKNANHTSANDQLTNLHRKINKYDY